MSSKKITNINISKFNLFVFHLLKNKITSDIGQTIIRIVYVTSLTMLFFGCKKNEDLNCDLMGQNNAIWSESKYLRGYQPTTLQPLTYDQVKLQAINLKKNNIKYVFLFAGPYDSTGHLPRYPFSQKAKMNVKLLKKFYPELIILPWIGGIQNKTVHLENKLWVNNAIDDTKLLIENLQVSGIHIDFEYILAGDEYLDTLVSSNKLTDKEDYARSVNNFHAKLRTVMPEIFISSVVVATSKDTKPWKRKTTVDELRGLLKNIDQLCFLYYDTSINEEATYISNCEELIQDIKFLKTQFNKVQYLVAYGTFINVPQLHKYRNLDIENIDNSLNILRKSILSVGGSRRLIDGIAIFCDWETDEEEWGQINNGWSGRCHRH